MKKALLMSVLLSILFTTSEAQRIIDNPETPLNAKSGRIVALKEVMRIRASSTMTGITFAYKMISMRVLMRG